MVTERSRSKSKCLPLVQSTLRPLFLQPFSQNGINDYFKIEEETSVFDIFVVDAHLFGVEDLIVEADGINLIGQQLLLVWEPRIGSAG